MDDNTSQTLMRLLTKDVLKANLAQAGLYVLAYEMLKNSLIGRPKGFFTMGRKDNARYKEVVSSRHPNILIASCLWFQEVGAITEADTAAVLLFREHRNYIAHELPNVLLDPNVQIDTAKLIGIFELLCKIDRWWIMEVEVPTNPDFDRQQIDPGDVRSGSMEFVRYLINVVFDVDGEDPRAASWTGVPGPDRPSEGR
jgi:hypothetical protein